MERNQPQMPSARLSPPPKEKFTSRIRRLYRSRVALRPLTRWLITTGILVLLIWMALFIATSIWTGDPGLAIRIATTVTDPFETEADWVAVPLLVLSVFLVPAFIGAAAALIVEEQIESMRRSERSARKAVVEMVKKQEERQESSR